MSYTDRHLFFDDIQVGQEWESLGRTITETDIVQFAGLSGDFNPIHIDHEFARTTPFGKPIAHGLLVFAIGSGLGLYAPPMRTLAFLSIREWCFKEPVFIGDTLRMKTKVLEIKPRSRNRRAEIAWQRQIINQHSRTVQEGVTLTLVQGRAALLKEENREAEGSSQQDPSLA